MQDVEVPFAQQPHQPPQRERVEPLPRLEQGSRDPRLTKDGHQFPLARQHRRLQLKRPTVCVRQQRQQMVLRPTPLERRDQLQNPNRPPQFPQLNVLREDSLHAALFYGPIFQERRSTSTTLATWPKVTLSACASPMKCAS